MDPVMADAAAAAAAEAAAPQPKPLCRRCKAREATQKIRSEPACSECYCRYINTKAVKRLEALRRELPGPEAPRRYLAGLSFGASSSCLLHVLQDAARHQLQRRQAAAFEAVVVHVDADLSPPAPAPGPGPGPGSGRPPASEELLGRYRARYPLFAYERVPLASVLDLDTIDWASLAGLAPAPAPPGEQAEGGGEGEGRSPRARLAAFFARLPSATARADVLRVLVRHALVAAARRRGCDALLLGHSTTALAELALGETAKGRGFALAWQAADGRVPVPRHPRGPGGGGGPGAAGREEGGGGDEPLEGGASVLVYYPLREVFRGELVSYAALTAPPVTDLLPEAAGRPRAGAPSAVVSHRDLSIEEVMARYFEEVEASYPSVVANVVRTTARLERPGAAAGRRGLCGLCGTPLDEQGDERWAGEVGGDRASAGPSARARLCYGCKRSLHG